jgi:nucleotide-binding universal stress UspA family protein
VTEFASILVPLDGSPRAEAILHWVRLLPARKIRLLRVCANETGRRDAEAYLEDVARQLESPATTIDARVETGMPAEAIVAAAKEASLIAMCTRGAGGGGRLVYGSVADRVARHAPVPTLLLRGGHAPVAADAVRRVVVPLDGSAAAERALPMAETVARVLGAPMHLVTVIESADEASTAGGTTTSDRGGADIGLEALVDRLGRQHIDASTEVRAGDAVTELLAAVGPGDVIVATTHGQGTARRWQIGHVADRLLRQAQAPVLLVRADD